MIARQRRLLRVAMIWRRLSPADRRVMPVRVAPSRAVIAMAKMLNGRRLSADIAHLMRMRARTRSLGAAQHQRSKQSNE